MPSRVEMALGEPHHCAHRSEDSLRPVEVGGEGLRAAGEGGHTRLDERGGVGMATHHDGPGRQDRLEPLVWRPETSERTRVTPSAPRTRVTPSATSGFTASTAHRQDRGSPAPGASSTTRPGCASRGRCAGPRRGRRRRSPRAGPLGTEQSLDQGGALRPPPTTSSFTEWPEANPAARAGDPPPGQAPGAAVVEGGQPEGHGRRVVVVE